MTTKEQYIESLRQVLLVAVDQSVTQYKGWEGQSHRLDEFISIKRHLELGHFDGPDQRPLSLGGLLSIINNSMWDYDFSLEICMRAAIDDGITIPQSEFSF